MIHHSHRGSHCVSIRYTKRLKAAGIEASVGSVGDSCVSVVTESMIGRFKTELIRARGPWRSLQDRKHATLDWVHLSNYHRLHESIGYVPPTELEPEHENANPDLTEAA